MSFSSAAAAARMGGPGHLLESYGSKAEGAAFNPRVALRLLAFLRPYWLQMLAALALMFVATFLTLSVPYLVKVAIDQDIAQGNLAGLARDALLIAAAFGGLYLTTAGQRWLLSYVGLRVLANLRRDLFRHLQALPLGYNDTHIVGVTISRVINDVSVINDLLSQGLVTLVGDSVLLIGIVIVMISMSPQLALLAFSVLPLMVLATFLFTRRAQVAFRQTRSRIGALVGDMAENLSSMRVIQAFAQEDATQERFERLNRENRDTNIAAMSLSFVFLPTVEFLGTLATGIVLWFGGTFVVEGAISLGVVVAFLAYVTRFFEPIQELSQLYTTMQAAMAGGERVLEVLDTQPEIVDRPDAIEMPPIAGHIELDGVSFTYRRDVEVLHDVSLRHRAGPDRGAGGADRRGQDLHRQPGRAFLRRGPGRGAHRRHRRARCAAALAAQPDGAGAARPIPLPRHHRRQHRLRPARCAARGDRGGGRARPHRRASSPGYPAAMTRRSRKAASTCRWGSANSSASRAPRWPIRAS